MPLKGQKMDTRHWFPSPRKDYTPGGGPGAPPAPVYTVTFMDLAGANRARPRAAQMDCLPKTFIKLEAQGLKGYIKRTWVLADPGAGRPVYWEEPPTRFEPDWAWTGSRSGGKKRPREVEVVEEEEWGA